MILQPRHLLGWRGLFLQLLPKWKWFEKQVARPSTLPYSRWVTHQKGTPQKAVMEVAFASGRGVIGEGVLTA